jgi:hypothetical protein
LLLICLCNLVNLQETLNESVTVKKRRSKKDRLAANEPVASEAEPTVGARTSANGKSETGSSLEKLAKMLHSGDAKVRQ